MLCIWNGTIPIGRIKIIRSKLILNNNDDKIIHVDKISRNDQHCEVMIVNLVNDCNSDTWQDPLLSILSLALDSQFHHYSIQ